MINTQSPEKCHYFMMACHRNASLRGQRSRLPWKLFACRTGCCLLLKRNTSLSACQGLRLHAQLFLHWTKLEVIEQKCIIGVWFICSIRAWLLYSPPAPCIVSLPSIVRLQYCARLSSWGKPWGWTFHWKSTSGDANLNPESTFPSYPCCMCSSWLIIRVETFSCTQSQRLWSNKKQL